VPRRDFEDLASLGLEQLMDTHRVSSRSSVAKIKRELQQLPLCLPASA
jgi:hypothetical protein